MANQGLNVVLRDHPRARENFQQAARLGHRQHRVNSNVTADIDEVETAGRAGYRQVREQRDLGTRGGCAAADRDVLSRHIEDLGR